MLSDCISLRHLSPKLSGPGKTSSRTSFPVVRVEAGNWSWQPGLTPGSRLELPIISPWGNSRESNEASYRILAILVQLSDGDPRQQLQVELHRQRAAAKMVKSAVKFTPEVLISTPRRSAGKPSPDGRYILHSLQAYSFEEHKRTKELRVLETERGLSHLVVGDGKFSEAVWLLDHEILYLRSQDGETGRTELVVTDVDGQRQKVVAAIDGAVADIKVKSLGQGKFAFVCWGRADRHGNLVNEKQQAKPKHTSMVYDKLMVRHWDTYKNRLHNSLFHGILHRGSQDVSLDHCTLESFESLLAGTNLECPIPPFPSSDYYDIAETGVIFVSKDPKLNEATHTKSDLYFIPLSDQGSLAKSGEISPLLVATADLSGAAQSPTFAPDGRSAAFLKMRLDAYEADRNLVIYVPDIAGACLYTSTGDCSASCAEDCTLESQMTRILPLGTRITRDEWDISPSKLVFGKDSNTLFLLADQEAVGRLYHLSISDGRLEPISNPSLGSVLDVQLIHESSRVLTSGNNLVDNSFYTLVDPENPEDCDVISSHSRDGRAYGLHKHQLDSFYFEGADGPVHALMMKPSDFDESRSYPLVVLIHGGPEGVWLNTWSTRWNFAVWAEQGYVVVAPNITGSTSYGQEFTRGVLQNWGGSPYQDIVKCMDHVEANLKYVDMDRAIAAGASYGGFMMFWIAGQPLRKRFKTLIAHDGVFGHISQVLSTDELWPPFYEFDGPPWADNGRNERKYSEYDPARFAHEWDTPMLVIHNGNDHRIDIAEGLAAFNVLQAKNIPSRFLTATDENHWTLGEENSRVWHTVVLNWANKYAGLPAYRKDEDAVIEASEPFDTD